MHLKRLLLALIATVWAASAPAAVIKTIQANATDQSVVIRIIDSTDGTPETGVVFNTAGIDLEYWRHGANAVTDITEATQTANGAHSDGGFIHLGNGNYRLDLPDAAVASGVTAVEVMGTVTGMIVIGGTVDLSPPANVVSMAADTVTASAIATDAIGAAEIAADAIGASELATDAIGAAEIAADAIGASELATGAITTAEFASGAINAAAIAADAIGASEVAADVSTELLTGLANLAVNVAQVSADSGAADTLETWLDGTAGAASPLGIARQGTAQSATATTLVMDTGASFADDTAIGMTVVACGSTQGYCQSRSVTDSVLSTDTLTVETWTVTPSGTITYYLFSTAPSSGGGGGLDAAGVRSAVGLTTNNLDAQLAALQADTDNLQTRVPAALVSGRMDASVGAYQTGLTPLQPTTAGRTLDVTATGEAGIDWANVGSPTTSVNLSGTTIATSQAVASVSGAVGSVTGAVGSVTGNVGGNVTGSVGSVATGGITSGSFAANSLTAAAVAADLGTEIGTAAWATTTRSLTTLAGITDLGWNSAWDAEVQSEANDALVANLLDQLLLNTYNPATPPGATDSLLEDLIENDAGVTRFSSNALEQAPTGSGASAETIAQEVAVTLFDYNTGTTEASAVAGSVVYEIVQNSGGGGTDWTADERTAMRAIFGIPGSGTTPADPSTGILDTIRDGVADVPTNAELATSQSGADDDTLAAIAALNNLSSAQAQTAATASLNAYDPPTHAELTSGLASADDAVLAAIAALNNLSTAQIRDLTIEDQGSGVSLACALSVVLAYAAGDLASTGANSIHEDPSGAETRITGTVASAGNRTASITCPTF